QLIALIVPALFKLACLRTQLTPAIRVADGPLEGFGVARRILEFVDDADQLCLDLFELIELDVDVGHRAGLLVVLVRLTVSRHSSKRGAGCETPVGPTHKAGPTAARLIAQPASWSSRSRMACAMSRRACAMSETPSEASFMPVVSSS